MIEIHIKREAKHPFQTFHAFNTLKQQNKTEIQKKNHFLATTTKKSLEVVENISFLLLAPSKEIMFMLFFKQCQCVCMWAWFCVLCQSA